MDILSDERHADVIGWLPHGKGFVIYKKKKFAVDLLPLYFKKCKFTSFTRKLNRWGFTRITRGPETGAYYHEFFQKGDFRLCMQMSCHPSTFKFASQEKQRNLSSNPLQPSNTPAFEQGSTFSGDTTTLNASYLGGGRSMGLGGAMGTGVMGLNDLSQQNQQESLIRHQLQQLQLQQLHLQQLQVQQQQQQIQASELMRQIMTTKSQQQQQQMESQSTSNINGMGNLNAMMQQQMMMMNLNPTSSNGDFNIANIHKMDDATFLQALQRANMNKRDDSSFLQSLQRAKESGQGLRSMSQGHAALLQQMPHPLSGNNSANNHQLMANFGLGASTTALNEPTRPPAGNGRAWAA